jgi:hypothetical protein
MNDNRHINEEEMILHFYDEPGRDAAWINQHVSECEECRARFDEMRRVLNSVDGMAVPERGEFYGREVWNKIQRELKAPQPKVVRTMPWRNIAAIAAMLVVGVAGFLIGRGSKPANIGKQNVASAEAFEKGRQRVLLVALTDHFEKSQMVLAELSNADPGKAGRMDIRYEREEASDLLESNRLYRQAAMQQGDTQSAVLLDDLERMLLELAHAPDEVGSNEFEELRKRIEDQGLVFKVKVLNSRLQTQSGKL